MPFGAFDTFAQINPKFGLKFSAFVTISRKTVLNEVYSILSCWARQKIQISVCVEKISKKILTEVYIFLFYFIDPKVELSVFTFTLTIAVLAQIETQSAFRSI